MTLIQNDTVSAAKMDGYFYQGTWKELDISFAPTHFSHSGDIDKISVDAKSINKKATLTGLSENVHFGAASLDLEAQLSLLMTIPEVDGNLYFRDETTIWQGKQANYNNDRVVFYTDDYRATDFIAYVRILLSRLGAVC